jgi:hypothetical protein
LSKVLGWFFGMICLIAGFGFAKDYSVTGNMAALGVSILCFGCVFWLSKVTYATSKRVMTATTAIMVVTGLLSWFVLGDLAEFYIGINVYITWAACVLVIGLPIMIQVFKKED